MKLVMSALAAVSLAAMGASADPGALGPGKSQSEHRPLSSDNTDGAVKDASMPGILQAGSKTPDPIVLADGRRVHDRADPRETWISFDQRSLIKGCPPGLAASSDDCRRPVNLQQDRLSFFHPDWWGLPGLPLASGNFLFDDGYLLHLAGDTVGGYIPLLGGALSIGNPWPSHYAPGPVPDYYVNYFDLGPRDGYRYADNVLYRIDPKTDAITSIAALLTGQDIRVGRPLPKGYDVYNVPFPYRAQYPDGPDAEFRYSDGYIYQVDPRTHLVSAAIELLAS